MGALYFIQGKDTGRIKIGWTSGEPERRRQALQCGSAEPLLVMATLLNCERHVESSWHRRFAEFRHIGEWFAPAPELLSAIDAGACPAAPPRAPKKTKKSPPVDEALPAAEFVALPFRAVVHWALGGGYTLTSLAKKMRYKPDALRELLLPEGGEISTHHAAAFENVSDGSFDKEALANAIERWNSQLLVPAARVGGVWAVLKGRCLYDRLHLFVPVEHGEMGVQWSTLCLWTEFGELKRGADVRKCADCVAALEEYQERGPEIT